MVWLLVGWPHSREDPIQRVAEQHKLDLLAKEEKKRSNIRLRWNRVGRESKWMIKDAGDNCEIALYEILKELMNILQKKKRKGGREKKTPSVK